MEVVDSVSDPRGSFPAIPEIADPDLCPFNDDSSLVQMLDDLQEGTLLSLLEDDHLFSDLRDCPLSPGGLGEPLSCLNGGADELNSDCFNALEELFGEHGELVEFGSKERDTAGFSGSEVEVSSSGATLKGSGAVETPPDDGSTNVCRSEESVSGKLRDVGTHSQSQPVALPKVNSSSLVLAAGTPSLRKRALRSCEKVAGCKKPRVMSHTKGTAAVRSYSGSDSDIGSTDSDSTDFEAPPPKKGVSGSQAECSGCPAVADTSSPKYLLTCVQHDHCYALQLQEGAPGGQSSPLSVGDTSIEEGSNSDTGYETMSAATSPGSSSGTGPTGHPPKASPPPTTFPSVPLPPLPPLGSNVDPVALIDARIKHFMCSQQINLTEEEKETLKAEGMPIPTTLPLTKTEERALKTVRRKIRNKVAAQESRKRKKEHMHTLEDRVMQCTSENLRLKKKVETLESENKSLMVQLKKLKAIVAASPAMGGGGRTTQVGACLMVVVLCFAIFFGSWTPLKLWGTPATDYTTATVRSRSLLSIDSQQNFKQAACSWFRHTFFRDDPPADSPLPHTRWREEDSRWPSDLKLYTAVTPITIQRNNLTRNAHISAKA